MKVLYTPIRHSISIYLQFKTIAFTISSEYQTDLYPACNLECNAGSASAAEDGLDRQRMEEENQQRGGEEGERSDRYLYKNAGGEDFRHLQYTGKVNVSR